MDAGGHLQDEGEPGDDQLEILGRDLAVDRDDVLDAVLREHAALVIEESTAQPRGLHDTYGVAGRDHGQLLAGTRLEEPQAGDQGAEERHDDDADDAEAHAWVGLGRVPAVGRAHDPTILANR